MLMNNIIVNFLLLLCLLPALVRGCCTGDQCSCEPNCWEKCFLKPKYKIYLNPYKEIYAVRSSFVELSQSKYLKISLERRPLFYIYACAYRWQLVCGTCTCPVQSHTELLTCWMLTFRLCREFQLVQSIGTRDNWLASRPWSNLLVMTATRFVPASFMPTLAFTFTTGLARTGNFQSCSKGK